MRGSIPPIALRTKSSMSKNKSSEWYVDPVRLLISEGKLVRLVTVRKKGSEHSTTETVRGRGPIAALSTTTQDRLEIDDETRHISLWMDASPEQTKRILKGAHPPTGATSEEEVAAWRQFRSCWPCARASTSSCRRGSMLWRIPW